MKLVILSCAFEDYLNTDFLLYVWGSEPLRYIVLSVIGENGTWDPPASPIPSSSCSVTLLLGNLKGSIPQGRWEQSTQHPVPSVCLGSAGHRSFQHRAFMRGFSLGVLCYYMWSFPPVCVKAMFLLPAGMPEPCEAIVGQRWLVLERQGGFRVFVCSGSTRRNVLAQFASLGFR